jgi:hypothetical protein
MTISALRSSVGASVPGLIRLITGEYTAASVVADPRDASRLWLVKQQDGNYGTTSPALVSGLATGQSSRTILASLDSLRLGGQ